VSGSWPRQDTTPIPVTHHAPRLDAAAPPPSRPASLAHGRPILAPFLAAPAPAPAPPPPPAAAVFAPPARLSLLCRSLLDCALA